MFPILNPPLSSLPIPSLWVVPVHQPQYSCLENSTDRGALWATVHGVTKSQIQRVRTPTPHILRAERVSPTVRYRNESFKSLIGTYSTVPSLEMDYSVFNFMFHLMKIFKPSFLCLTETHQKFIHYDCWS